MFFITSKVLAFVTSPVIWLLTLLLYALLTKNEKRRWKMLLCTTIVFYLLCNPFLQDECFRLWEMPAFDENSIKVPYDAGIILGGAISYDPSIERTQFQRQGDRVIQALILYKKGKIKKIVFSGGAGDIHAPQDYEGPHVKEFLLTMGIPESDILIESESRNTHQNAAFTKELLDKNFHNGTYLLITTSTHQRRALKCFEKAGVSITPYSVDRFSGARYFTFDHFILPNTQTLFNWEFLTHEMVGWFVYKIAGYI